ncbi:MAG: hypothetical protein MUP16_09975, partial [Sedimentisphaerales bacterium]|nr:hypothetical protein [Sedimentisphaerales bacterium]
KTRILFLMVFVVAALAAVSAPVQAGMVDPMTYYGILRPPTETGRWADERGAGALMSSAFSSDGDGSMMIDYGYWVEHPHPAPPGDPYDRVPRGYFEMNIDHPEYAPALPNLTGLSFTFSWYKGNADGPEHVRELQIYSPNGMARFAVANGGEAAVGDIHYTGMVAGWQDVTTAPVGSSGWTYEGTFDPTNVTTIDFWVSCWHQEWVEDPPGYWYPIEEQLMPTGTPVYIDEIYLPAVVSWRPYTQVPLGPNDFQAPVPDINDRTDPCTHMITFAEIWVGIDRTHTGKLKPDPNDPNKTIYEPNSIKLEAGFDPNKSWNSDTNDPNIMKHEKGHLDIEEKAAREAQAEIDKKIENGELKGVGKDPNEAIADVNDKIQKIIDEHVDKHHEKYDDDTIRGYDEEEQKKATDELENDLTAPNKDPDKKIPPDAESASNNSCTYNPGLGLAFENNIIVSVPDPLDPIIGAELIMPVFNLVGQTVYGEIFFQSEAGASTVEIRKDNQTYLSVEMDYMLYSPTENMFYGLGMAFQSDMPEGISAYVDGVCQALTSKNTLTLYGVEIYPEADFMVLTDGFTTSGDCPTLNTSGMRIVGSGLEADLNEDYRVDFRDFAILGNQWFQAPGYPSADISQLGGDGIVNFEDLALLADQWLEEVLWP